MADELQLTLVIRPPETSKMLGEHLLAGTFNPAELKAADTAADPADVQAVLDFAARHNLRIIQNDPAARTVRVAGSVADIEKAFGILPGHSEHGADFGTVESLDYKGPLAIPAPLDRILIAVLGLDQTPIARPHS